MKIFLFIVFLCFLWWGVHTAKDKSRWIKKHCNTTRDCGKNECCVKRGYLGWQLSRCRKMGQEGDQCVGLRIEQHGTYWNDCPCIPYHKCEVIGHKVPMYWATVYTMYNRCVSLEEVKEASKATEAEEKNITRIEDNYKFKE